MTKELNLGKNFWYFRFSQMVSLFGDQVAAIAISFYILEKSHSAASISMVMAPTTFIVLCFTLILGPLADNLHRKTFITLGNFCKAFIWILIATLCWYKRLDVPVLCCLFIINGIGEAVIIAGSSGFLPELVTEQQLSAAFGINVATNSAMKIVGGVIAGIIVGSLGMIFSFIVNIFTFIYAAITTIILNPQIVTKVTIKKQNFFYKWQCDFKDGVKYVLNNNKLRVVCVALFIFQFIVVSLQIALPVFVKQCLNESPGFLGVLLSAEGAGAILTSSLLNRLKICENKIIFLGFCITAGSLFLMGIPINKELPIIFLLFSGAGVAAANMTINIGLLKITPEDYRSRFFTIIFFVEGIAAPLGLLAGGTLIDNIGVLNIFKFMGVGLFLLALIFLKRRVFNLFDGMKQL